jgi:hypothetical protein
MKLCPNILEWGKEETGTVIIHKKFFECFIKKQGVLLFFLNYLNKKFLTSNNEITYPSTI